MSIDYGAITTESIGSQIAKRIQDSILEGKLAVDERLPTEEELAAKFGVSRPTIREALKRLAARSLVRSRRGASGGTFVNRPSLEEAKEHLTAMTTMLVSIGDFGIPEILEVRHQLELVSCRFAALRRESVHLETMAGEIEVQEGTELSDIDFCASDVRFHRALVDAAGNSFLGFLMTAVIEALQPVSNLIVFRFRDRREIVRQHRNILEAVQRRDPDGAAAALTEQMIYLREHHARAQAWREARDANTAQMGGGAHGPNAT